MAAGFRSTRRTKIICTIGPSTDSLEMLATLAAGGMNVARLNMPWGPQVAQDNHRPHPQAEQGQGVRQLHLLDPVLLQCMAWG